MLFQYRLCAVILRGKTKVCIIRGSFCESTSNEYLTKNSRKKQTALLFVSSDKVLTIVGIN